MAVELQVVENPSGEALRTGPTVVVAPPPNRGGRYRLEFRSAAESPASPRSGCGHQSPQALLWLIFLEEDQEAGREVTEVICSACDPARFARAQAWAEALV